MQEQKYNLAFQTTSPVQITLFRTVETPVGRFVWDPAKVAMGIIVAGLSGTLGLFGGTYVGLQVGSSLLASLSGMVGGTLGAAAGFLRAIKG